MRTFTDRNGDLTENKTCRKISLLLSLLQSREEVEPLKWSLLFSERPVDKMEASVLVTKAYRSLCIVNVRAASFPPDLQTSHTIKVKDKRIVNIYQQNLFILFSVNICNNCTNKAPTLIGSTHTRTQRHSARQSDPRWREQHSAIIAGVIAHQPTAAFTS